MLLSTLMRRPDYVKGIYCRGGRAKLLEGIPPDHMVIDRTVEASEGSLPQTEACGEGTGDENDEEPSCYYSCFGFAKDQPCFPPGSIIKYTDSKGRAKQAVVEGMIGAEKSGSSEYAIFIGFRSPGIAPSDVEHVFGPCTSFSAYEMDSAQDAAAFVLKLHSSQMYTSLWGDQDRRVAEIAGPAGEDAQGGNAVLDAFMQTPWGSRVKRMEKATSVAVNHLKSGKDSRYIAMCGLALRRAGFSKSLNIGMVLHAAKPEARAARVQEASRKFTRAVRSSLLMHPAGTEYFTRLFEDYMRMECGVNVQRLSLT